MQETTARARVRLRLLVATPRFDWLRDVQESLPDSSWYIVGGTVRDAVLDRGDDVDVDLVVRGTPYSELRQMLEHHGRVDLVGRVFGVIKFRPEGSDEEFDIALPRTERAGMSGGYRDFAVQSDQSLPIESDLARRDFTVNAIAYDVATGALLDPYAGIADAEAQILRTVGVPSERFSEDLSRALRGVRFACRLGFDIEPATEKGMISALKHLLDLHPATHERLVPKETVASELVKAIASAPSRAVQMMDSYGVLTLLIPELSALKDCAQSPNHHSEGDAWTHTLLALDALESKEFETMFPGEKADAETVIATLLHDIAKPQTAQVRDGHITFYGHAEQGAHIAKSIAERLVLASASCFEGRVSPDGLAWLLQLHLFPITADLATVRKTTLVRHFLVDRPRGRRLLHLAFADASSSLRPDGIGDTSHITTLLTTLHTLESTLGDDPKKTILSGDEIMSEANLSPGPEIGKLLEALHEAQLQGQVTTHDQAKDFIKKITQ